ncbi:aldehyde dehydrogenase family protein [Achromobacter sp. Root83]|uniref:aldehyde dehydrogenase family protein n=1 Tax=Achromobacter sp. Root83 TaxID=1736602 RepID=UPI000AF0C78F|nr:aldehyde dehydrogenase family protein [Achromobacter sp. Root83]
MTLNLDSDYTMTLNGLGESSPQTFDVLNPATEARIAAVPDASLDQLNAAIAAARAAFVPWRGRPIAERQAALRGMADRLEANAEGFMRLLTREQGKPHADARAEVGRCVAWLRAFAARELPVERHGDGAGHLFETRRVAIGVVAAIAPWNFPMTLAIWKIAPALLAGNTVVLKPSPYTPLTSLKMGELFRDLVPPGVLNVISGGDRLGPWLTEHPGIDKIAFTGSTATGRRVMQSASGRLKRVTLELGGNDAAIVLPDVDVKDTAGKLFWGAFRNSSQYCLATKRLYVHESIYDAFADALAGYAAGVVVGDGAQPGTGLGPIQNRVQFERVKDLIADAHRTGVRFLTGGDVPEGKGYFVPVTILDNPPDDARSVVEEAFGPVLPLLKYRDIDEAIRRANDTEYGLGGSVWCRDEALAQSIARRLETGTVWINHIHAMSPDVPFGGHKQSGLGVENAQDGLLEYTNAQTVAVLA